ncbi:TraR/DksA family transcriptional regulator [Tranquillimonas rosea]|uniref:TraR/DksA family transcriptional regulator n=1 Tax=Tranquillimonas rosea TaxID=641238 RepID=UPI003BAA1112
MFTEDRLAEFARIIDAAEAALDEEDRRGGEGQRPVELDQQSMGRLSRMDALQQQALAQAGQRRRDAMRTRLQAARRRIESGEFGYCTECGDEIAEDRLAFDPTILRCRDCMG